MKGDDVLLLNPHNLQEKVIYGESKYRSNPSNQTIEDIISNLEGSKSYRYQLVLLLIFFV